MLPKVDFPLHQVEGETEVAQKVSIVLVDDLDGSEAVETVRFGIDGSTYEIDLSAANAEALRDTLSGYVGGGRKSKSLRRAVEDRVRSQRLR